MYQIGSHHTWNNNKYKGINEMVRDSAFSFTVFCTQSKIISINERNIQIYYKISISAIYPKYHRQVLQSYYFP